MLNVDKRQKNEGGILHIQLHFTVKRGSQFFLNGVRSTPNWAGSLTMIVYYLHEYVLIHRILSNPQ